MKLEAMELRKVNGVNTVPKIDKVCRICGTMEHPTNECPTILAFKEVLHDQANAMNMVEKSYPFPYSETYNSRKMNHPNFSWRNENVVAPPTHGSSNFVPYNPPPKKSLEDTLQQFMQTQSTINNQNSEAINEIRCTLSKLTISMSTIKNELNQNFEILEVLRQVKVNIPLLDAIKQTPSYAKFLKDLCTVMCKLNVHKKAFLTKHVSAIIQNNRPPKFRDPGCPTISYVIGNSKIEKNLLDFGASVNLLPYSVYEQLSIVELKPTSIILQLADRSVIFPKGVIKDGLIQVDKFYFPVNFIILDMHPVSNTNSQISMILGRPFLATSNALINCRSGVLKLSFGNMTLELNIFNTCKQTRDEEVVHEVNLIEIIVQDQTLETCLVNSCDLNFDEDSEISYIHCLLESAQELEMTNWKLKFKELPPCEIKLLPSSEQVPKWELKP
nr:uncharacterized protein LOC112034145 [Quercus suber]